MKYLIINQPNSPSRLKPTLKYIFLICIFDRAPMQQSNSNWEYVFPANGFTTAADCAEYIADCMPACC